MKKIILATTLALTSFAAQASTYGYHCTTDTGKDVNVAYSYNNGYTLEKVDISGYDFVQSSSMSNTRGSGLLIHVSLFHNGEDLQLTILGTNSTYQLGSGSIHTMSCKDTSKKTAPNDGI